MVTLATWFTPLVNQRTRCKTFLTTKRLIKRTGSQSGLPGVNRIGVKQAKSIESQFHLSSRREKNEKRGTNCRLALLTKET